MIAEISGLQFTQSITSNQMYKLQKNRLSDSKIMLNVPPSKNNRRFK